MSSTAGIFKLGINLMLVDNFTNKFGIVEAKLGKIDKWANNINDKIKGVITPMNAAFVGIGTKIMKDFAETEDATIQLRNTMMGIGGVVSKEFEAVSKKAEDLGAKLPGTTADFYKMASAMRSLGVGDKSLSSALEATAKMAVVLKSQGVSFEQASEATAKFKNALGIADNDMVSFADTVQRTAHMGVNLTEMQYAFARSAGILKVMNLQGLQSANALSPVVAMLIKTGASGETAGTALSKIFSIGIQKNQFKDVEGMFTWLEKLDTKKIHQIFGGGSDEAAANVLWKSGRKGYQDFVKEMENQGSLEDRIKPSLNSLTNTWEAMGGAINKVSVATGNLFAENLKGIVATLGDWADKTSRLITQFPTLTKGISSIVLGLASISLFKGLGSVFGAIFIPGITMVKNFAAAMGILNSVQLVSRGLWATEVIKEYGIVGRLAVGTTNAMTVAQAGLNKVANMNPYLLLVIGAVALTGAIAGLNYMTQEANSIQNIGIELKQQAKEKSIDERAELDMMMYQLRVTNAGSKERIALVKQLEDKYKDQLKGIDLVNAKEKELIDTNEKLGESIEELAYKEVLKEEMFNLYKEKRAKEIEKKQYVDNIHKGGWSMIGAGVWDIMKGWVGASAIDDNHIGERIKNTQELLNNANEKKQPIKVEQVVNINGNVNDKNILTITHSMKENTNKLFDNTRGLYDN